MVAYGGVANNPVESLEADSTGTAFGSSVATAKVTGAISRIWAVNPDLSYRQIIDIVKTTATDLGVEGNDVETGAGLVNLAAAVALAKVATPEDYKPEAIFSPDSWSGEGQFTSGERAAGYNTDKVLSAVPSYLKQNAQQSVPKILAAAEAAGVTDRGQVAYILATAEHESHLGRLMSEIWEPTPAQKNYDNILGNYLPGDGYRYRGRGYVQITGRTNYQKWSQRLGVDLIGNPDLALNPDIAARILVEGMRDGSFTGVGLGNYINGNNRDFYNARRIVNGIDRASDIAKIGERYYHALVQSSETNPTNPIPSSSIPPSWKMSASAKGAGQVAVGRNADGRLEAFTVGPNGTVYQSWQLVPNGGWSNWQPLSNKLTAKSVTVAANADGRLEVFAIGGDDKLYQVWQTKPNSSWSNWQQLSGTTVKDVTVGQNSDGRLEVFAIGTDSKVYHTWQSAPNANWVGLNQLAGGIAKSVSVGRNADGRLEAFVIGTDNKVYQVAQNGANGAGGWGNWKALSNGSAKDLVVGQNADGRLEAFMVGLDNKVYQAFQTSPNGNWGGWYSLSGGSAQSLAVGRNQDGRLEVFAKGLDGKVYQVSQTAPNGGWSSWQPLLSSGNVGDLTVSQSQDGRLEAFTMTGQTDFNQAWQVKPNSGWSGWLKRPISSPSPIPLNPPQPGTNGVPSDAGQHQKTVSNTSGLVQYFYENGRLEVQPNGQKIWYWTASQNLLQVGRGSRSPQIFQTAYNKINGTSQGLKPQGDAYRWGNGWTQKFRDKNGSEMLLMLEDSANEAFWVGYGNLGEYKQMDGATGHLGYPRSNEIALPNKPAGSVYQVFATENGKSRIHYSPKTGSVATWGSIGRQYTDLGGAYHWLGMPTRREYTYGSDTIFSDFEGGKIAHQKSTGKVEVLKPGETASWLKSANLTIQLKPGSKNLDFYRGQVWETNGYKFTFQTDGNLVLSSPTGKVLWAAGSEIHGANRFSIQTDGNVVLYRDNNPLWASNTAGNPGSHFAIQPDGNLVVYAPSGKAIFNTGTYTNQEITRIASPNWIRDLSLNRFPNLHFSTVQSVKTGKALDAGGANTSVYPHPSLNPANPHHQWGFHKVGDYYMLINKATGFALDAGRDGGKYPYGYLYPDTNNNYHLWKITPNGSGYQIVSKETGRALDAGGDNENSLYMYPNPIAGNSYHQWKLNLPSSGTTPGSERIINAVNKVNPDQYYYRRHDITGDNVVETFCNWFAADVLECLGVPIPRQTNSPYKMNPPVFGGANRDKPISAENLYTFFHDGGGGKWQKVSAADAAAKANNGQAVVASSYGHIAIVIPGSSASNVRIAQAGWENGKNMSVSQGFGSHSVSYFTYVG